MYKLITLILALFLSACSTQQTGITHLVDSSCDYYNLKTAQCENTQSIVNVLKPYKIIFIGDHHDAQDMHQKVALLITELTKNGTKVQLANEWFYPSDKELLAQFSKSEIDEKAFQEKIRWKERLKRNKYESFAPMYRAVRETKGELYGINISKMERKKISEQNLTSMSEEELNFNKELDLQVSPHKELIMPFLSHCHAPKKDESLKECSERMYRVQVAWDSKMALETYKLSLELKENEKLLVFAGAMHIETGLGIPLRFARLSNEPFITIIPADQDTKQVDNDAGDIILFYKELPEQK